MAAETYTSFRSALARKRVDWAHDTIRAMLVAPSYAFSFAHRTVADVLEHELENYTRVTVPGRAVEVEDGADAVHLVMSLFAFSSVEETTTGVIFYQRTGPDDSTPWDDILLGYEEFVSPLELVGEQLIIEAPSGRLFTIEAN